MTHSQSQYAIKRCFLRQRPANPFIRPWDELVKEDPSLISRVRHCPPGIAHGAMQEFGERIIPQVMFDGMVGRKPNR